MRLAWIIFIALALGAAALAPTDCPLLYRDYARVYMCYAPVVDEPPAALVLVPYAQVATLYTLTHGHYFLPGETRLVDGDPTAYDCYCRTGLGFAVAGNGNDNCFQNQTGANKIWICHRTNGNPPYELNEIPQSALATHLSHGDKIVNQTNVGGDIYDCTCTCVNCPPPPSPSPTPTGVPTPTSKTPTGVPSPTACTPDTCAGLGYTCLPAPISDGCLGDISPATCTIPDCQDFCENNVEYEQDPQSVTGTCDGETLECLCTVTFPPPPTPSAMPSPSLVLPSPTPTPSTTCDTCASLGYTCLPEGTNVSNGCGANITSADCLVTDCQDFCEHDVNYTQTPDTIEGECQGPNYHCHCTVTFEPPPTPPAPEPEPAPGPGPEPGPASPTGPAPCEPLVCTTCIPDETAVNDTCDGTLTNDDCPAGAAGGDCTLWCQAHIDGVPAENITGTCSGDTFPYHCACDVHCPDDMDECVPDTCETLGLLCLPPGVNASDSCGQNITHCQIIDCDAYCDDTIGGDVNPGDIAGACSADTGACECVISLPPPPPSNCTPLLCSNLTDAGYTCIPSWDPVEDGCGGHLTAEDCDLSDEATCVCQDENDVATCNPQTNQCECCTPQTCASLGFDCLTPNIPIFDGCGGFIDAETDHTCPYDSCQADVCDLSNDPNTTVGSCNPVDHRCYCLPPPPIPLCDCTEQQVIDGLCTLQDCNALCPNSGYCDYVDTHQCVCADCDLPATCDCDYEFGDPDATCVPEDPPPESEQCDFETHFFHCDHSTHHWCCTPKTYSCACDQANAPFCLFLNCTELCADDTVQGCDEGTGQCTCTLCTPASCADQGMTCGSAPDGCGNTLDCGLDAGNDPCDPPAVCVNGQCAIVPCCGDGVVSEGEACDDGSALNGTPLSNCTLQCQAAACADGFWQPWLGEECDAGDTETDYCLVDNCTLKPGCGGQGGGNPTPTSGGGGGGDGGNILDDPHDSVDGSGQYLCTDRTPTTADTVRWLVATLAFVGLSTGAELMT